MPTSDMSAPVAQWRRKAGAISHDLLSLGRWMGGKPLADAPSVEFTTPGGGRMKLTTDRVRARPALTPQLSFMLGQNAIGLGVWGLLFPKAVNRFLGVQASPQATQALFGAREMATGLDAIAAARLSNVQRNSASGGAR